MIPQSSRCWCLVVLVLQVKPTAGVHAPLIGIYPTGDAYYLFAYQQWLEQFGARTLILPKNATPGRLAELFKSTNGLLLPGGAGRVAPLARRMVERALRANMQGDYYPVWGTCLGFEWIVEIIGGTSALDSHFQSIDLPANLEFTPHAPGRIFADANSSLMQWFAQDNITYNMHVKGITPHHEERNQKLLDVFDVLASSTDRNKRPFVSVIEAKHVPIYGTQFHPEKIQFVSGWSIPKTPRAIAGARYLAQFFVREARRNRHSSLVDDTRFHTDCHAGSDSLCTCTELEQHGYIRGDICREYTPTPAIEACKSGACSHAPTLIV